MRILNLLILLFVVIATNIPFSAQVNKDENREIIKLEVTVTDRYGRNVSGLKAENFKIIDEGEIKPVAFVSSDTEPSSIGILVDVSGSILPSKIAAASDELIQFISEATPGNEYFAFSFTDTFSSLIGLTKDTQSAKAAIRKIAMVKPQGNTKLFDAIKVGCEQMEHAGYRRKVIIVLGDASDNVSKTGYYQIRDLVRDSNIQLYNLASPHQGRTDELFQDRTVSDLETLSAMSGGKAYFFKTSKELNDNLKSINLALQTQYLIGLEPTRSSTKDKRDWRKIKIKIDLPKSKDFEKGVVVSVRDGYYAPVR